MRLRAFAISIALLAADVRGQDLEPARVVVGTGYIPTYEEAEPRPTPHLYLAKVPRKAKKSVRKFPAKR